MPDKLAQKWDKEFNELLEIYEKAKAKADYAVNHVVVDMYWEIGKYLVKKLKPMAGANLLSKISHCLCKNITQV